VAVFVLVPVAVIVAVLVAVAVAVAVSEAIGVFVAVGVSVARLVAVGVLVAVGSGVGVETGEQTVEIVKVGLPLDCSRLLALTPSVLVGVIRNETAPLPLTALVTFQE
jgi:hypothetical protein